MSTTVTTQTTTSFQSSPMTTNTEKGPVTLSFGEPKPEEYESIAKIITDSFVESSKALFGENCPELLAFRVSLIRQRDSLMKLYQQKKIRTNHQIMVARDSKMKSVIGVAIWSLEDDFTGKGIEERNDEIKLASPMSAPPKSTNMPMYKKCQIDFAQFQARYLQSRPRCCK